MQRQNPDPNWFTPNEDEALDRIPLQIKTPKGLRERIRRIPNWQQLLRQRLLLWVDEWERDKQD
jgi:hypothetical protein